MKKIAEDQDFTYFEVGLQYKQKVFNFRIQVNKRTGMTYFNTDDIIRASGSDKTVEQYLCSDQGLDNINDILKNNPVLVLKIYLSKSAGKEYIN